MNKSIGPAAAIVIVVVVALVVCGVLWKVFVSPKGISAPPPKNIPQSNPPGAASAIPNTGGGPQLGAH